MLSRPLGYANELFCVGRKVCHYHSASICSNILKKRMVCFYNWYLKILPGVLFVLLGSTMSLYLVLGTTARELRRGVRTVSAPSSSFGRFLGDSLWVDMSLLPAELFSPLSWSVCWAAEITQNVCSIKLYSSVGALHQRPLTSTLQFTYHERKIWMKGQHGLHLKTMQVKNDWIMTKLQQSY